MIQNPAPSGASGPTENVNIADINGSPPSLTNPIFTANSELSPDTIGTFTNGTQTTSVTTGNIDGYDTALVSINGTYGTATAVFEVSDDGGSTFYAVSAARVDGSAAETGYTTLTNTNRQWLIATNGNDTLRVRSTAVASGTVNVRITITSAPASALTTGISQSTQGATNNVVMDGVVDGAVFTGTAASAATLVTLNTTGYDYLTFGFTSVGATNTVLLEVSNDGTPGTGGTFGNSVVYRMDTISASTSITLATTRVYIAPVTGTTMRLRVSTYGSGTITTAGALKRGAPTTQSIQNVQLNAGAALVGSFSIDQTTPGTTNNVTLAPLGIAGVAIAPAANTSLASSKVLKNSAGNLYGLTLGATTVAGYFMLFNATTLPADGAVTPVKAWPVTTNQALELSFNPPLRLGTGIVVGFSSNTSTPFTLANSATAFIDGEFI